MMHHRQSGIRQWLVSACVASALALGLLAVGTQAALATGIVTKKKYIRNLPPFDLTKTDIKLNTEENWLEFSMEVTGFPGTRKQPKLARFEGSRMNAYMWMLKADPSVVGFEKGSGTLTFAIAQHPNFDDASGTSGGEWHAHWMVIAKDDSCGERLMKIVEIPEGSKPALPKNWSGQPVLLANVDAKPVFSKDVNLTVRVPVENAAAFKGTQFDGATMGWRIKFSPKAPLFCTYYVYDIISDDWSFPGVID